MEISSLGAVLLLMISNYESPTLCRYLATCGLDRYLKIWDLRSTQECLSNITLPTPAVTMCYSQTGLLALGSSTTVQVRY